MSKTITPNQLLGEIGEAAVRLRFLTMGFQFDARSRLEAGIDGIAEVMDKGKPLARMIAVQVKSTDAGRTRLKPPQVSIIFCAARISLTGAAPIFRSSSVLYRKSDDTYYWKEIQSGLTQGERRLRFEKAADTLDRQAVDRLAELDGAESGRAMTFRRWVTAKKLWSTSCPSFSRRRCLLRARLTRPKPRAQSCWIRSASAVRLGDQRWLILVLP